jgi:lipopolysaccharide export system permease protein
MVSPISGRAPRVTVNHPSVYAAGALRRPLMRSNKIDRYVLELMTRPVLGCIIVTLVAQLLDRVLRIINQLAESGAHLGFVVQLTINIVPYYLSLSLPASFFIGIFLVIARLGDDNEIDAILASGISITRLAAPFFALGLVLTLISIALFGFLQPYGRYAYQAVMNAAINAGWNAQLQPEVFVAPGGCTTITADRVGANGRNLRGVFVRRCLADGREQITTAASGVLNVSPDGRLVELKVDKGLQLDQPVSAPGRVVRFQNVSAVEPTGGAARDKPRGANPNELTILELMHELKLPNPVIPRNSLQAELNGRLVRSLSPPILPMLAIPLGMAAKRGRRTPGLILAGVLLIGFHHGISLAQNLAETGRMSPNWIWWIALFFDALCAWMFLSSLKRPGDTPITRAVVAIGDAVAWVRDLFASEPMGATS